jgi:DNA-binding HxlR family transcriptional regulator
MYRYGQYCPVARAAELLADRWTVLIVRELLADVTHFNGIERGLPGISRALLVGRLQRLAQAGVVERHATSRGNRVDYRLTPAGRELEEMIDIFGKWGAHWAFGEPRPNELDPIVLLWWMQRRVCRDRVPRPRVVIEFEFRGSTPRRRYWLVIERTGASVCLKHPGFDVDVFVTADIAAFYRVWLGHLPLSEAVHRGQVHVDGMPADVRSFPQWFTWSPMADTVRAALAAGRSAPNDAVMVC